MSNAILEHIQKFYPGYHPVVSMAHIAHNSEADLRLQFECHKAISKFVTPELKSIEVKTTAVEDNRVVISLFDDRDEPKSLDHIIDVSYEPC